jgi:alpha-amylase/alpha-mannosidase (GH57 family)
LERYVCIHGHFYQPPRENPWLEAVELQDSAYPYHDWNERITTECYAPNAASRILDADGRIKRIVNNYARISFNVGPTLLGWIERHVPDVYRMILQGDRESRDNYSGHGSAMAQAYSHMILPLANRQDKRTQVIWGVRDFERRFSRRPEGMWLPETAVDLDTLEALAAQKIRFTVLAPYQAARVRKLGTRAWRDVSGGRIDPSMAYEQRLRSGRKIAIFFYDGPISHAVAFEGLLNNGEHFAGRLHDGFDSSRTWPQLVHIATDGESYGHHHRHGDMALSYALQRLEANPDLKLTNYGEFLAKHPPQFEVDIIENTSWSCAHGVERWRSNCGCNAGTNGNWTQAWRAPLRAALDWLRDELVPRYEQQAGPLLRDPWGARDDYIAVIQDRSPENIRQFLSEQAARALTPAEQICALKLLELQRHLMLMYTSCGWFFDELSGLETVQILQYAGRAVQLAQELFGDHLEDRFVEHLAAAKSNLPEQRDGAHLYETRVKPARVDLLKVGAHYAISSLFEAYPPTTDIYCYTVERQREHRQHSGRAQVVIGRAQITSQTTLESAQVSFGVLHFGDHNLNAGVREFRGPEAHQALVQEISGAFAHADLPQVIRRLDQHFGGITYSLKTLFRDEQRRILGPIIEATAAEAEAQHRQIYEHHAPLMRFVADLGMPLPTAFRTAIEAVLNADLRRAFQTEPLDLDQVVGLLAEARSWDAQIDRAGLGYRLQQTLSRTFEQFRQQPTDLELLERLGALAELTRASGLTVDLWQVQNAYWDLLRSLYPQFRQRADQESPLRDWPAHFVALGHKLGIRVEG